MKQLLVIPMEVHHEPIPSLLFAVFWSFEIFPYFVSEIFVFKKNQRAGNVHKTWYDAKTPLVDLQVLDDSSFVCSKIFIEYILCALLNKSSLFPRATVWGCAGEWCTHWSCVEHNLHYCWWSLPSWRLNLVSSRKSCLNFHSSPQARKTPIMWSIIHATIGLYPVIYNGPQLDCKLRGDWDWDFLVCHFLRTKDSSMN